MIATDFPQANKVFGPPPDLDANQVEAILAFVGPVTRGSVDGLVLVVTAWQPTAQELEDLQAGAPVFLSFIGGLPPHFATTRFENAINPA